ncbi:aldo/keto reductase [Polaribacter tangerinus]|uniref:aldo/keto reductase n=1 Tax=Polaribacter tangerinus TaxID=1920034 RepID=UPI0029373B7D|nr:aldo/keto reductase [Polaribacter tangerinus]
MIELGLGTAAIGRPQYINIKTENNIPLSLNAFKEQGFAVLENAYKLGIRYFDTAPGYGLAEELVLEWVQTKNDKNIEIGTKWGYTYTAKFNSTAKIHEVKEHSLQKLKAQWAISKKMLPYLKVYQIHSATLETKVLENTEILNYLANLKEKYQLQIGITTTGKNQIEVLKKALDIKVNNIYLFDVFQITYNLLEQSLSEISEELLRQNKQIIIKEALANGRIFRNENYQHYKEMYDYLEKVAQKYKVGVDAIALKYCSQTIPNSTVLSGASTENQLKENKKLLNISLTKDEINCLNKFKVTADFYWNERKKLIWN